MDLKLISGIIWMMIHFSFGTFSQITDLNAENSQFNEDLDFFLSQPQDSILKIDPQARYVISYKTTCPFNHWIDDTHYIDSGQRICIRNVQKVTDPIQLNFDLEKTEFSQTGLKINAGLRLTFSTLRKDPTSYDPFCEKYTSLASFDNGRYIILSERHFGPDIRSSMPPGDDITYFIERD